MMVGPEPSYRAATRHPLAAIAFVLPLLIVYEVGLYLLASAPTAELRNGADAWLRGVLEQAGVSTIYGAPILLVGGLIAWCAWRWDSRPRELLSVWIGMVVEGSAFAMLLACLSQALYPLLQTLGGVLEGPASRLVDWSATSASEPAWERLIGFVGAGIYEETLFRLLAFPLVLAALLLAECPRRLALGGAALVAAVMFAAAHNLGPHGEPFHAVVFVFRTIAGLYFTWIFQTRGYGIAVGAHVGYDVIVGLLMRVN